jgi:predicted nucleotide-binding protein
MVRQKEPQYKPSRIFRSTQELDECIAKIKNRVRDLDELLQKTSISDGDGKAVRAKCLNTIRECLGAETMEMTHYEQMPFFDHYSSMVSSRDEDDHDFGYFAAAFAAGNRAPQKSGWHFGIEEVRVQLMSLISELEEKKEFLPPPIGTAGSVTLPKVVSNKVFIVHGHDDGAKQAAARFVEHQKLEAIILAEQADEGLTIIEKFEKHASQVGFAIVVMTPDDLATTAKRPTDQPKSRARQNVIFELGYFMGRLGRGKVCMLHKGKISEDASDLAGIVYVAMASEEDGDWKLRLVKNMKVAGLPVSADNI